MRGATERLDQQRMHVRGTVGVANKSGQVSERRVCFKNTTGTSLKANNEHGTTRKKRKTEDKMRLSCGHREQLYLEDYVRMPWVGSVATLTAFPAENIYNSKRGRALLFYYIQNLIVGQQLEHFYLYRTFIKHLTDTSDALQVYNVLYLSTFLMQINHFIIN